MTTYSITLGYNWDGPDRETNWAIVQSIVSGLRDNTHAIAEEAIRLGCPPEGSGDGIGEYLAGYLPDATDLTIRTHENIDPGDPDYFDPVIRLAASGGDPSRSIKHHLRRAFCRLVMEGAHRRGIEVNINVS